MSFQVLVDWTRTTLVAQAPTDISGLALWWKASDLSTLADGAAVSSWTAAEGTSTASQGTGSKQPTKQTVNGETAVRFDGSNDNLTMNGDALTVSQNKSGVTLMARAKVTPAAAAKRLIYLSTGTASSDGRSVLYVNASDQVAGGSRRLDADAASNVGGGTPGSTLVRVMTAVLDYANTDAYIYMDGTQVASNTAWLTAGSTSNTASLAAALGSRGDSAAEFLGMDLYDVLIWPRALTGEERQAAEAYLRSGGELTSRVMANPGVFLEYGRDQSTALAPVVAGRGGFTLNNESGHYNPLNTSSPIYGYIKPARPVRIQRSVSGTTYTPFAGHTDDTPLNPDLSSQTVTVSLVDYLADFRGFTLSTALYSGLTTGGAIDQILDEVGWTGTRDLDTGSSVLPYWWEEGTDALQALEKLVQCEGPPALLSVGSNGGIIFRDRQHRLLDSTSTTSQATWVGSGTLQMHEFTYDDAWRNIINTGKITVDVRLPQESQEIWTLDSPISLGASEAKTFIAASSDPFINAVTPASGTDYSLLAGSVTPTLSRTSGASTTITLTAGGGGATLDRLALRAQPVSTIYSVQAAASDSSSIAEYGPRSFPGETPFCNIHDAQAVLDTAVQMHSEPLPVVTGKFAVGQNATRAASVLSRDLSDRVTLTVSGMSLNDDFFLESFRHDFATELDHTVTVGMEAVPPAGAVTDADIFIIGSSVSGHRIGTGKLAL